MKRRTRIQYTDSQKALMWERWRQGESLHQIARLFDRHHSSVRGILAESGGIRPPARRRSMRALSLAEREDVSRALCPNSPSKEYSGTKTRLRYTTASTMRSIAFSTERAASAIRASLETRASIWVGGIMPMTVAPSFPS